jgi:uncharacterized protein YaaW (UPF0174 family)
VRVALFALSALAAYVVVRAAFIFLGPVGAGVVGIALAVAAFVAWRRPLRPLAAGLVLGATASALALAV